MRVGKVKKKTGKVTSFFRVKTCYLAQEVPEKNNNQWKNSLIIIGLLAKDTCFAEKPLLH